jgi:hypothetical protein
MSKRDQRRITRELLSSFGATIDAHIDLGLLPAEWDGLEIRELIAELADRSRATSMRDKRNQRKRDYDNTVLVNDL